MSLHDPHRPGGRTLPYDFTGIARRAMAVTTVAAAMFSAGCTKSLIDTAPPTIEAARPAQSPPTGVAPAGQVRPLPGAPRSAVVDDATGDLVVLTPDAGVLTVFGRSGPSRVVRLPGPATALAADGAGLVFAAARGGFFTVELADGASHQTTVDGHPDTDFTAIARRGDGRMVLGSADGSVLTLAEDNTVAEQTNTFAHIDSIVVQQNSTIVLDRRQTSVTELNEDGSPGLALRAGLGATSMAADPMGRVLVTDTRGGQLLVFGVDPLMERQAYPVDDAPYGVVGSKTLVWVSLTATNTVVGYDLATGIPVEKVRYPTVRQPNALAFDDSTGTLYVVSGSGDGLQVIGNADGGR